MKSPPIEQDQSFQVLTLNGITQTHLRITMDGYIQDVRTRFGHPGPIKPQHSPHKHWEIVYGAKAQLIADEIDDSPPLDAAGIKKVQGIVGSILYYARAVDNKLLCTVSAIGMLFANNTIIIKRMRALEMRLNWLKDQEAQGQFRFFWDKGNRNKADYHTQHHTPEYHVAHRPSHAG